MQTWHTNMFLRQNKILKNTAHIALRESHGRANTEAFPTNQCEAIYH